MDKNARGRSRTRSSKNKTTSKPPKLAETKKKGSKPIPPHIQTEPLNSSVDTPTNESNMTFEYPEAGDTQPNDLKRDREKVSPTNQEPQKRLKMNMQCEPVFTLFCPSAFSGASKTKN